MHEQARGRGATARRTWTVRAARFVVGAGVVAGGLALGAGSTAAAESCPVFSLVACPGTAPTTTAPPPSTTTTVAAQTAAQARERLLSLVNGERTQRGLAALTSRADVVGIASRWSDSMANAGALSHDDAYFSKASHDRLSAALLGENVARAADVDQAHRALMASEHHRDNILDARFTVVGFGATMHDGTWWITEDFLQPRTTAASSTAAPTPTPPHAPHSTATVERARGGPAPTVTTVPADATVVAVAAAAPHEVAVLPQADAAPGVTMLAGEAVVDHDLQAAVVAVAALLVLSVLALRWSGRRVRAAVAPIAELGPAPVVIDWGDETDRLDDIDQPDEIASHGLHHRLAMIDAWVRTLDDRWPALSESDKRVAMQIIRRNTQAAIDEMPELSPAMA